MRCARRCCFAGRTRAFALRGRNNNNNKKNNNLSRYFWNLYIYIIESFQSYLTSTPIKIYDGNSKSFSLSYFFFSAVPLAVSLFIMRARCILETQKKKEKRAPAKVYTPTSTRLRNAKFIKLAFAPAAAGWRVNCHWHRSAVLSINSFKESIIIPPRAAHTIREREEMYYTRCRCG